MLAKMYAVYGVAEGLPTGCNIYPSYEKAAQGIRELMAGMVTDREGDYKPEVKDLTETEDILKWAEANSGLLIDEGDNAIEYLEYRYVIEPVYMSADDLRDLEMEEINE